MIFHNNKIKSFVETEFQEKVDFCHPIKKNDSLVIYPACIGTTDMIASIQNLNVIEKAGEEIRKAILYEQNYGLAGKLCYKTDLEFSWNKTVYSDVLVTFVSTVLNIKKSDLLRNYDAPNINDECEFDNEESQEEEDSVHLKKRKIVQARGLVQSMHYLVHDGKNVPPMQVMFAHSVYNRCKSKEILTQRERVSGVSAEYLPKKYNGCYFIPMRS